jgi:hypothetical protein
MKNLLFTICLSAIQFSYGQDTLIYRGGSKESVRVVKVDALYVSYLTWPVTDSSTVITKSSRAVGTVKTEDGKVVNLVYVEPLPLPKSAMTNFNRNFIALDLFDLFYGQFTLSYQYTFRNSDISLRVPLSTSFIAFGKDFTATNRKNFYSPNKYFSSGLDLMFNLQGRGNDGFVGGLSYDVGRYKYFDYMGNINDGSTIDFSVFPAVTYNGFFLRGGYMINRLEKIAFSFFLDAGMCSKAYLYYDQSNNTYFTTYSKIFDFDMRFKLCIGYSF